MTNKPTVSIGIITYKHQDYIAACLDSLLAQDYAVTQVLLSDDASPDQTIAAVNAWKEQHPDFPLTVFAQPKNLGIAGQCNFLLDRMTGDYLVLFAGDDLMQPDKISQQVRAMEADKDALFSYTNMEWFDSDSGRRVKDHFDFFQRPPKSLVHYLEDNVIPSPTVMIRGSGLNGLRYDPRVKYINDFYFIACLMRQGKALYVPHKGVRYRKHPSSITSTNYFLDDRRVVVDLINKEWPSAYHAAARLFERTLVYAQVMTALQKNDLAQACRHLPRLALYGLTSRKWLMRSGYAFYTLLKTVIRRGR